MAPPEPSSRIGAEVADIPPPAPALAHALAQLRPVRTRRPWLSVVITAVLVSVWPLSLLVQYGVRRDWSFLPAAFSLGFAVAWAAALFFTLRASFVPQKHQVLPDTRRAGRLALAAGLLLTVSSWFLPGIAPGHTIMSPTDAHGFWLQWWRCTFFSLQITASVFLVGLFLLRKIAPVGRPWLGAGLGGAGGALGGLVLHLLCPVGDAPHVALSHGGGMLLGLAFGAILLPLALRTRRAPTSERHPGGGR